MRLSWTDQLSVGNALIDGDHKNLIGAINRMTDAIGREDRSAISEAFDLLDAYLEIHARNEERIAEQIGYRFACDKLAQRQARDEMRYMMNKLAALAGEWPAYVPDMYARFLDQWMHEHISKINMPMKPALQAFPYELIPGMGEDASLIRTSMVLPIESYFEPAPSVW